jgi:hypothetical protein
LNEAEDQAQAEVVKLSEALLLCQCELSHVRAEQEQWLEENSRLRAENAEVAARSAKVAGALAGPLADAYWRNRGKLAPVGFREFIASRWPWLHKLLGGRSSPELEAEMQQVRLIELSPLFDANWYLQHNPDVAEAGVHPALHYLVAGVTEDRAPGPSFDPIAYRREHPELVDSGVNPLLHYLQSQAR